MNIKAFGSGPNNVPIPISQDQYARNFDQRTEFKLIIVIYLLGRVANITTVVSTGIYFEFIE